MTDGKYRIVSGCNLKLACIYFLIVFAAGFILGTIRVVWLVPRAGLRNAELLEMPLMITVTVLAARWLVHRFDVPFILSIRLAIGLFALIILLVAEFGIAAPLQGMSPGEAIARRDPISGAAYLLSLVLFALMPSLVHPTKH
jgi:hypothetical protein